MTDHLVPKIRFSLPNGGLPEVISPYLKNLIDQTGGANGPIGRQFVARPELELSQYNTQHTDPLSEDINEVAPGLVYKHKAIFDDNGHVYPGRALFTITRNCASYCRYCTRGREVGIAPNTDSGGTGALSHVPTLSKKQIDDSLNYIENEAGLNEVILSGGDPLTVNINILSYICDKLGNLQKSGKLSIVRIGTRAPIQNPLLVTHQHIEAFRLIKNPRFMVHINHPLELTPQSLSALNQLRTKANGIVMSQSVLLKGVNDNLEILSDLFNKLAEEGIIPYYIYQNDEVPWAKHFTVPINEAIELWQKLRPRLSGVAATARFVIDIADGYGKIPLPEGGAWTTNWEKGLTDFNGNHFELPSYK